MRLAALVVNASVGMNMIQSAHHFNGGHLLLRKTDFYVGPESSDSDPRVVRRGTMFDICCLS